MSAMVGRSPLLLATRSAGKLAELKPLFASRDVAVIDLDDLDLPYDADEDGIEQFDSFEQNALAKARYFYEASGGMPTVADDSGLEIFELNGAPGVRSKRWADASMPDPRKPDAIDAANNAMLVRAVTPLTDRRARYVCAAAYVGIGGRELVERGEVAGTILTEPRGQGGFGYDPYFVAAELGRTFGEASRDEKARVSHRGRAFSALLQAIATGS
jgi:XTP/dITP diphosphohydrolase